MRQRTRKTNSAEWLSGKPALFDMSLEGGPPTPHIIRCSGTTATTNRLSGSASRVYIALQTLAQGQDQLEADYNEICAASVRARATVAKAIEELKSAGWVTQQRRYGRKATYTLHPPTPIVQNTCSNSSVVQKFNSSIFRTTGGDLHIPHITAAASAADDAPMQEKQLETQDQAFERMKALLSEFMIGEPVRTQLARILAPKAQESELRRIYEVTRQEWERGKVRNLPGMTVLRLRDYSQAIQQGLPGMPLPAPKPEPKPKGHGRSKTHTRKQQIELSGQEAEERQARARQQIEAKRAAQGETR